MSRSINKAEEKIRMAKACTNGEMGQGEAISASDLRSVRLVDTAGTCLAVYRFIRLETALIGALFLLVRRHGSKCPVWWLRRHDQ